MKKPNYSLPIKRFKQSLLLVAFFLSLTGIVNAQYYGQQGSKLVGTGSVGYSPQGASVAISADGNTAIVGADQDNANAGAVYFYTRSGVNWVQQGPKMLGNDMAGTPRFGYSVSISADGNTAAVGGYLDSNPIGAVWVFTRSGGVWTQQGSKLVGTGSATSPIQGWSVAISGDGNTIMSGGQGDNNYIGAVWAFTRSGGVWTQQGDKLVGTGGLGTPGQGQSVSLSYDGNTAIVGGKNDNGNTGAAWMYKRSGGIWAQQAKLVGTGAVGQAWQGYSVAISGDGNTAIVGGYLDNTHTGAVWIFTQSGGVWSQQGNKLVGSDYVGAVQQGSSVSLSYDGNKALVAGWNDNSAIGCAWLYTRSAGVWTQLGNKLTAGGDRIGVAKLGNAVALSADGNTLIAGAPYDNSSIGAAWVFNTCTTDPPKAAITGATSGNICSGYVLSVADTSGVGKFISSYSWSDGSTTSTSNPITANGTYTVTITNSCGYTSTTSQIITNINASPAPLISGGTYFCSGSSKILTASDANNTAGPLTYNWSNGSTAPTSNPITTAGTYTVSITNGIGCTNTAIQVITSNPISITSTSGAGASGICYTSLKAAFDAINNGIHTGDISILVLGNTTETATCVLNASGSGSASYTSILMQPSGGAARSITCGLSNFALIELNGADNVVIDGLNTNGNALSFSNTSVATSLGTSTIRFINDASNNKITRCTILGNSAGVIGNVGAGTIVFGTALATGNDNDTLSYCNIGSSSTTSMATRHIYAGGTVGMENNDLVIDNNYIGNFFRTTLSSSAIDIASGTTGATISNNRIYQSATRTFTTVNLFHRTININNAAGSDYKILNNRIGFADTSGTGTYTFNFSNVASTTAMFTAIYLNVGTATATSVQGNTITNLAVAGSSVGTAAGAPFKGIYVVDGLVKIGDVAGNTIGSMTATGNITFISTGSSPVDVIGILVNGSRNAVVSNNNIGGITVNTNVAAARNFYGIRSIADAATNMICDNNTIGGDIANSIHSKATQNASRVNGIMVAGPAGSFTGNTIRNMTTSIGDGVAVNAGMAGIVLTGTTNQTAVNNKIYNLSTTATTIAEMNGIYVSASGTNMVERNLMYGFSSTSVAGVVLSGIRIDGGTGTYSNNMIAIGEGVSAAQTTVNGFNETAGSNNIWNNSVYIGGSPASGAGTSFGLNSSVSNGTRSIRNNVFYNARSNAGTATGAHYSISVANSTGLTINNNLYYATGTGNYLGAYGGTNVADLTAWKTATGQDANSVYGNPFFKAPTAAIPDIHINPVYAPSIVDANGADLGITEDFDGDTRASLTPTDIGADAFVLGGCLWLGTVDTLWSNTSNWSCGAVPTINTDVTISGSAPNMPTVNIIDGASNDITIESGASIIIGAGSGLNIQGNIVNSGTFSSIGKATFSGEDQTIPGGSYVDLEIAGTGTKALGDTIMVSGMLALTTSNLELGNNMLTIGTEGSISGGSASNYIVINGTGTLKQQNIGTGGRTGTVNFPIGTAASYTPLSLTNSGTSDEFGVSVINNVYDAYNVSDSATGTPQTSNNVDKTWKVTESVPGGSMVTLDFQWNLSDELPGFDRAQAFPAHYKNGIWNAGSMSGVTGSDPYTISLSGITSFSPFAIGSTNSVLPLTLVSFNGKEVTGGITLYWTTSHEVNTAAFDIERSNNGGAFVTIATVAAGTSGAYSYIDNNVMAGTIYSYRLKMRDKDGKSTNSPTISIRYIAKETTGYLVYPNPVMESYLKVKPLAGNNAHVQIAVVDVTGRTWYSGNYKSGNMRNGTFEIPVAQLPAGAYVLRISDKNGENLQVTKFTVVK